VFGHKTYKCDRHAVKQQLNKDYFGEHPIYDEDHFHRRYCHLLFLLSQFSPNLCNVLGRKNFFWSKIGTTDSITQYLW
jgi:hypothetical protein